MNALQLNVDLSQRCVVDSNALAWNDSPSPLVGYCILNAEDLDHAEALVSTMPIIDSVRVYEAHSM